MNIHEIMSEPVYTVKSVDDIARQRDNDRATLVMVRRVAPGGNSIRPPLSAVGIRV
jgi:hypothetical protein